MLTVAQINQAIISGEFSNDQLDSVMSAVKFARNQITRKNTCILVKGSAVKFTNSRTGVLITGNVEKVNPKFIHVRSGMTVWRVPGNMLSAA